MKHGGESYRRKHTLTLSAAILVIALHLSLSLSFRMSLWITPLSWLLLDFLALIATVQESLTAPSSIANRWQLFALSFVFAIGSLICILFDEATSFAWHNGTSSLNNLLRACRWLPLLLAICTTEELDQRENRILDLIQICLLAFLCTVLFTPFILNSASTIPVSYQGLLINTYAYTQSVTLTLIALLAIFTSQQPTTRFFYAALSNFLCVGVPLQIWYNLLCNNTWQVPPSSPLSVPVDLGPLVYLAALQWMHPLRSAPPRHRSLILLRLGAPSFLTVFGLLASMSVALIGKHPWLGLVTALLSIMLYSLRSAFGQLRLLLARWDLEAANKSLEALSLRDPLTGLYNRRWFADAYPHEWKVAQRSRVPLSILLLDIDYFKLFNDNLGHDRGDACLQAVSELCLQQLHRSTDSLVRYGGEEFLAILPDTPEEGAIQVAQRIIAALNRLQHPHPGSPFGRVTLSIGTATLRQHDFNQSAQSLIKMADEALYAAKRKGRNCLQSAVKPLSPPSGSSTNHSPYAH
ncbi:MAG: GGDEF domain-containing protein [Acidobacteriaceae bacterium]|nr:GGDEF domain-containing protein [Acidobacteriaceae bacterium]